MRLKYFDNEVQKLRLCYAVTFSEKYFVVNVSINQRKNFKLLVCSILNPFRE